MNGWVVARRVAIVLAFLAVLLRPGLGERPVPTQVLDAEVLVVVDRTRSMAALDYQDKPRITGVRRDLAALADAMPGARFGLLTWGQDVQLELPFTTDTTTFTTAVETMRLEGVYEGSGSRADRPLVDMAEVLERAQDRHPERQQIVVFVGDGENTDPGQQESFTQLSQYVDAGVVLGYGTEQGARMPWDDDLSLDEGYVPDPETDDDAVSRADPGNLASIADQLGVPFEHRTRPGRMDALADDFDAQYVLQEDGSRLAEHDLTWLAGLLLLGLLLLELRWAWRALWMSHRTLATGTKGAPS